jgi:chaperonin GroES
MKLRPLYDRILCSRNKSPEKSTGGLHIPEEARELSPELTVIAVGHGRLQPDGTLRPLEVKPGDQVLVGRYSPIEVELHGEKFVIIAETDVLGILDGKK